MTTDSPQTVDYRSQPSNKSLGHIPGNDGWPILGRAIELGLNPIKVIEQQHRNYGLISRIRLGLDPVVLAVGPDNAQALHLDPDKNFSSEKGLMRFKPFIGGSLIMKDFEEHRFQRRLMQTAFKTSAMRNYIEGINSACTRNVQALAECSSGGVGQAFFPRAKSTLLEIAAQTFTGVEGKGGASDSLTNSFELFVEGFNFLFPVNLPGFKFHKGLRAKNAIDAFIRNLITAKRNNDDQDILAYFCREKDENGNYFSDQDIAENFVLLLFAAQDTTTASLVNAFYELGQHPEWQQRLREEIRALDKDCLELDDLDALPWMGHVFNEVQRLHSSVPLFPRRSIRHCELSGVEIGPNTMIMNAITYNHIMEEWWHAPLSFDPGRFERNEHKQHPFQFHPFGGGAHKCIGMHFAQFVFKTFLYHTLRHHEVTLAPGYNPEWLYMSMPRPKDGLPIVLKAVN